MRIWINRGIYKIQIRGIYKIQIPRKVKMLDSYRAKYAGGYYNNYANNIKGKKKLIKVIRAMDKNENIFHCIKTKSVKGGKPYWEEIAKFEQENFIDYKYFIFEEIRDSHLR